MGSCLRLTEDFAVKIWILWLDSSLNCIRLLFQSAHCELTGHNPSLCSQLGFATG